VRHVSLATGLVRRSDGAILLVASRYANHPQPLWNLPGGRQRPGELLVDTVAREIREETGYDARIGELAYVSESYDSGDSMHFVNATFLATVGSCAAPRCRVTDDHVVETAWVPVDEVGSRIVVAVVREPLLAYLNGTLAQRYAGFSEAGITIRWPDASAP
jgi:8-oxo-dGTP diphosphatase